jgi:hypothetical protein
MANAVSSSHARGRWFDPSRAHRKSLLISPAITLAIYAHEFAHVEHADRTRERMEASFGELIS